MYYIDPHIHMVSRTTDDYEAIARMGCLAVSEPAFWAGFDRGSAESFRDYFRHLTEVEPRRAAQFGVRHFTWLCINAKEAENVPLARDVISLIPEFLDRPNVLGIGEIGLNKNTRNEAIVFLEQVELAVQHNQLILIHTPHLEDKYQGTRMILDMLQKDSRIDPQRVLVDHVEEHTVELVLDGGFWAGMTLYPVTKCTPQRAADIIERYGTQRLMVNSAGDWGPSRPTAVPDFIMEMRRRGHPESMIRQIVLENPVQFFSQSPHFDLVVPEGGVAARGVNGREGRDAASEPHRAGDHQLLVMAMAPVAPKSHWIAGTAPGRLPAPGRGKPAPRSSAGRLAAWPLPDGKTPEPQ